MLNKYTKQHEKIQLYVLYKQSIKNNIESVK